MILQPQPGPQTQFLSSPADITIYGGAAGGGKSWGILAEPLRHVNNGNFGGVIFRRTSKQVRNEGSLWDESEKLYSLVRGTPIQSKLRWEFPSGARVSFAHLEHEKDKLSYQGAQIAFIGFDELTHFSESQFSYMLSRNRSTCGVRPYVRATTNPDADSWVAAFISWWIDQDTGLPIRERSGELRWFYRISNSYRWYDTREEAEAAHPEISALAPPKSVTFISASLTDNKILMQADPGYMANLLAMGIVDRERLLGGNWKIRFSAGTMFQRHWFDQFVDSVPFSRSIRAVRFWDQASSEKGDQSVGALLVLVDGKVYVADVVIGKWTWEQRNSIIEQTAELDKAAFPNVDLVLEEQFANKENRSILSKRLAKYSVKFSQPRKGKIERAKPFSAACERRDVYFVKKPWNRDVIDQLVDFPPPKDGNAVDDIVDALSDGYTHLILKTQSSGGTIGAVKNAPARSYRR